MADRKIEKKTRTKKIVANTKRASAARKNSSKRKTRSSKKKSLRLVPILSGIVIGGVFMFFVMAFVVPAVRDIAETFAAGREARNNAETLSPQTSRKPQTEPVPQTKNVPQSEAVPQSETVPKSQTVSPKTEKTAAAARNEKTSVPPKNETQAQTAKISPLPQVQSATSRDPVVQDSTLAATIPKAVRGANLVFVFDDGGQNMAQLENFVTLPFPITVAVLPRLAHSAEAAARVRASGNEVMLHQPMQAINANINPGAGAILPEMSTEEIAATMNRNISEIAPISGVNNHEGSLISEDEFKMMAVLDVVKQNGAFYLDSRTTSQTRVHQAAMEVGMGYYERNIFLDNTKNREDILTELRKGLDVANKKGCAIMIGHIWSADVLPAILRELYPILQSKGYTFSTVSKSGAIVYP